MGVGGFLRLQGLGGQGSGELTPRRSHVRDGGMSPRTIRQDVAKGSKCSGGPGSRRSNAGCGAGLVSTPRAAHTRQARGGSRAEPGDVEMQGAPSRCSARLGAGG